MAKRSKITIVRPVVPAAEPVACLNTYTNGKPDGSVTASSKLGKQYRYVINRPKVGGMLIFLCQRANLRSNWVLTRKLHIMALGTVFDDSWTSSAISEAIMLARVAWSEALIRTSY